MEWKRFTFIGLGLIGGSLAKAIKKAYPDSHISVLDKDERSIQIALEEAVVNQELKSLKEIEQDTDILFLCTPVEQNRAFLEELKTLLSPHTILSDVGSTKTAIMKEAEQLGLSSQFIGGHPMAGSEVSGYQASDSLLLENAYYLLTPGKSFPLELTNKMQTFLSSIGSIPFVMSPEEHDTSVACVSHLPHLIAACLVKLLKEEDKKGTMKKLAAGGFKDISRIASSSPVMWQQICLSNKKAIVEMMEDYITVLEEIKNFVKKEDPQAIAEFFQESGEYRNSMDSTAQGLIQSEYAISLHVQDHPGAISIISTILASNMVSIRNIGINHNREKGEGALQLSFYTGEDCEMAKKLLHKYGFQF